VIAVAVLRLVLAGTGSDNRTVPPQQPLFNETKLLKEQDEMLKKLKARWQKNGDQWQLVPDPQMRDEKKAMPGDAQDK
jgi:hypothetical protein